MKRTFTCPILIILLLLSIGCTSKKEQKPLKVEVRKENGRFSLFRNGQPYYIKGAAGYAHFKEIRACGGNSVRIWGGEPNLGELLDNAWYNHLSVTVGLYVGTVRHAFDFSDKETIKAQKEVVRKIVLEHKDHPAVLMWGIGNEVDIMSEGKRSDDPIIWKVVNEFAKMVHELDQEHPTTTMIVPYRMTIRNINKYCPEIDILSINTFGALQELDSKLKEPFWGWSGPYLISEWGATGWWEAKKTLWGAPIEKNSTSKAEFIKMNYENYINPKLSKCIGSYVFYWGEKQERTETWFSLFDEHGNKSQSVNFLNYLWAGEWPKNTAPKISDISFNKKKAHEHVFIRINSTNTAKIAASDDENDDLAFSWMIKPESVPENYWGENEKKMEALSTLERTNETEITFNAPSEEGAYRLFCYITDSQGNYSVANFPFYVIKP
jgi:hypothetical protein